MATHLIAYDIADPRRLRRVERLLSAVGQRVHYSLFVVDIAPAQMQRLLERLSRRIDPAADSIRSTPWCSHDQRATRHFGMPAHQPLPPAWIV